MSSALPRSPLSSLATFLFLFVLLCPITAPAGAQPSTDVPIQKVVFFKSGVSYVEHRGRVSGDATTTLRFQSTQMKDVLKSLVLQDLDGGNVGTIAYPSQDPLSRTMESFQVNLSEPTGLGPLLNQIRGADVTLSTPDGSVQGSVVGAEDRSGADGATEWVVTVYSDAGLQTVPLDDVQRLQLDDAALQAEMQKALQAVAEARDQGKKSVRIRFEGQGTRRVRIGYVVEAPVWKTSYRLLLPEGDEGDGQMQGWAIVENQTDADWSGVELTLVSGRPVSFVQDLYTPTYTNRPVVSPTAGQMLQPQAYEEGVSQGQSGGRIETGGSTSRLGAQSIGGVVRDASTGEALPGANVSLEGTGKGVASNEQGRYEISNVSPGSYTLKAAFVGYQAVSKTVRKRSGALRADVYLQPATGSLDEVVVSGQRASNRKSAEGVPFESAPSGASEAFDLTQGVAAAATAAEQGAFFQYRVSDVSLPRRRSAMLPIVTEPIAVERLSIYDPRVHETHPLRGARLENTTGRHLAAGPVTVFDDGSYAGDARLTDAPPGDTRFLSYALNQDVQVDPGDATSDESVVAGKIVDGVLNVTERRVASVTYTLSNEGDAAATIIVEHPRRDGWTLVEPEDVEETTSSMHRLRVRVGAGETATLDVRHERTTTETQRLSTANRDRLLFFAQTDGIPDDVRDALEKAADLQRDVTATENELDRLRGNLERIREEQSRIRENMKAVDAKNDYYQRLLDKLKSQEDTIDSLTSRIEDLEEKRSEQRERLARYLRDLDVD